MSKPKILIVGAGGLGLTCGYHLQLAGADISFLVRPGKLKALARPQRLYCYNDHSLKMFEGYWVFSAPGELHQHPFDVVMVTLDGATCRSAQGMATLAALGAAFSGSGTRLLICSVGIGLYEHVKKITGFADENLLEGSMGMFAYQVGKAEMPLPPPTDENLHNSADIAYLRLPGSAGFMLSSKPVRASKAFAQLYNRCGVARCRRVPSRLYAVFTNIFFPFIAACEISGWRGTDAVISDRELWQLCCDSQREIMGLKAHGIAGKLFSLLMTNSRLESMFRNMDAEAAAMDFTAFNRFHHGGKVREQDMQILQNCLVAGEREGKAMTALKTLLSRCGEPVRQK